MFRVLHGRRKIKSKGGEARAEHIHFLVGDRGAGGRSWASRMTGTAAQRTGAS